MHRAAVWQHSSNSNIKTVHNSIEHFLWNPSDFSSDDVLSCLWIVFTNSVSPPHFSNRTLEYLRHNFPWDRLISRQTDNPWSTYSQDLNLTIFWGGTWKTVSVKTIHRQERTSSEKKSNGFHKKCSIEMSTILMFELLMCCRTAARCMEQTQY